MGNRKILVPYCVGAPISEGLRKRVLPESRIELAVEGIILVFLCKIAYSVTLARLSQISSALRWVLFF